MTNAEARFNNSLRPRKAEGSLGRTAQDGHLDSHTAPELCDRWFDVPGFVSTVSVSSLANAGSAPGIDRVKNHSSVFPCSDSSVSVSHSCAQHALRPLKGLSR